jgi:hypothetical protein
MLRGSFYRRARAAVAPPGSVTIKRHSRDFIDAVTGGLSDVALVDPTLAARDSRVPESLSRAHIGTVLYIRLTPEYAQASVSLLRELGSGEIVTYGYNDDPATLAEVLQRQSRMHRAQMLLRALAGPIATLPPAIRRGIDHVSEQGDRINSVDRLVRACGVTRMTLSRSFRSAGMAPPRSLLAALAILRSYDTLIDNNVSHLDVALAVGVKSERQLQHRCLTLTGLTLDEIRAPISTEDLVKHMAAALMTM